MSTSALALVTERLHGSARHAFAAIAGLVVVAVLVSCGPLFPSEPGKALPEDSAEEASLVAVRQPPSVLVRRFEPGNSAKISLPQYRQADDYMHSIAPIEIGVPTLLFTRYAQTKHMPILKRGDNANQSSRSFTDWGFLAFVGEFRDHIRILEGRHANAAEPGDAFIEAVMMTEKLDEIGAQVGDRLVLIHRNASGSPEPIEVKIVGRWSPSDPDEDFWFYHPDFFNEGLIVAEGTYTKVILPGWEGIGYEYSWYMVFADSRIDSGRVDAGIDHVRANLAAIIGEVEVHVWPPGLWTEGKE